MKLFGSALLVSACLAFVGCSDGKLDTEAVTGVVTLDDIPLGDATVNFTPVDAAQGTPSYGKTDEKGEFKLQTLLGRADAGTTPGEYIVTISKTELYETGKKLTGSDGTTTAETKPKELVPAKYSDSKASELRATVPEGGERFTFELKSK